MRTRKTLTIGMIKSFEPRWWDKRQLKEIFGTRKQWTVRDVLTCDIIELAGKLWLLLRPEFLSDKNQRLFICDVASRMLRREAKAGRKPDPRSYAAVRTARRFAGGKATNEELEDSWFAASASPGKAALFASETACATQSTCIMAWLATRLEHVNIETEQKWQFRRLKFYLKKEH